MMWRRWSVYLVLLSLLVLAVCLSFAEGGEGTSVGGLCSVEESVLTLSWDCARYHVPLAIFKVLYILFQILPWRNATQQSDRIMYVVRQVRARRDSLKIRAFCCNCAHGVVTCHWLATGTILLQRMYTSTFSERRFWMSFIV